jgi:Transposase
VAGSRESRFIAVLREHEAGAKTAELARKHGISETTLYNWKAKYGGMDVSEAKRQASCIRHDPAHIAVGQCRRIVLPESFGFDLTMMAIIGLIMRITRTASA